MMDFTGYSKDDSLKLILKLYLRLLPFNAKQTADYMLIVTLEEYEYEERGYIWLFIVTHQKNNPKKPFVFTEVGNNRGRPPGQSRAFSEEYDVFDFNPEQAILPGQNKDIQIPVYDINKYNGNLFIYYENGYDPLHFVWNGEKYLKKRLVQRDFYTAREAKRDQE